MLGIEVKLYMELCSSRAWWPLAPNFCSWATRVLVFPYKSYAGQPRIYSFRALGSLQFSLEHSRYKWSPKKLCVCCLLSFCNIRKIWQPLDLNNAIIKWWLQPLCNGISNQNSNLQQKKKLIRLIHVIMQSFCILQYSWGCSCETGHNIMHSSNPNEQNRRLWY